MTLAVTEAAPTEDTTISSDDVQQATENLKNAEDILKRLDVLYAEWNNKQSIAEWNYASNLTEENLAEKLNVSAEAARVIKQIAQEVNAFPWRDLPDEDVKRRFKKLSILGAAALPEDVRILQKST